MKTVVVATGGFDPIHSGHVAYLEQASNYGDILVVGINSDDWLTRKKGHPFMTCSERVAVVQGLGCVSHTVLFDDSDGSAIEAIRNVKSMYPDANIVFTNGGDRTVDNIPEQDAFKNDNSVEFVFGVGGNFKMNSSSWILENYKYPKTQRNWGWYRVLDEQPGYKVKELVIEPGKSLSMQRHTHRNENWYVLKGKCVIETEWKGVKNSKKLDANRSYTIDKNVWHKGINDTDEHCHILEVQHGDKCIEEDIERK